MSKIETINNELINLGFVIEDNRYTFERVTYNTMFFNGQRIAQEQKHVFVMQYIGDGCELDDSDNMIEDSELCGFDILDDEGFSITTIFVSCLDDLRVFINI